MKKIFWVVGSIAVLVVLGFAYYAISPLFRVVEMHDPLPTAQNQKNDEGETAPSVAETLASLTGTAPAPVTGTLGHPAEGTVRVVEADGKKYLRYENFKTINGPDIYVYLGKDLEAKEFISLGKVKATVGDINYELPEGVDLREYPYALTWCKTFGVLFNSAKIY